MDQSTDLCQDAAQGARHAETGHSRDDTKTLSRLGLSWALCFGAATGHSFMRRFGRPGCALNKPTWSPIKGSSASVSTIRSGYCCSATIFRDPRNRHRHHLSKRFWTGGLETAAPGCYDAVAIARAPGFRVLVMKPASVMRRLSLNRSEPAKKSGQISRKIVAGQQ